jgi:hypothetical protein
MREYKVTALPMQTNRSFYVDVLRARLVVVPRLHSMRKSAERTAIFMADSRSKIPERKNDST